MLTRSEGKLIEQRGMSTLHDYWFNSLFAGEPYFEDGLLAYYDGRIVTLCGFPLRNVPAVDDSVYCRLAQEWVGHRGAESVIFVGPHPISFRALSKEGLRRVVEEKCEKIAAELFIDCTSNSDSVFRRRVYRRSRAMDFQLRVRTGGIVSAEHFRLVEIFYRKRERTGYLAEIAFALPTVLRSRRVQLIEARKDHRLCGFVAMHKPFADTAVGLFLASDHKVIGVCDFLYGAMLEQAKLGGASSLNVGPSPSIGHFNFKLKWGGQSKVPPYYFVQWARGTLARRFHTSWGPRLIRL
ncbi:MAG: hypothetical protein ABR501_00225 [Pyrinomonadaceae bacterium]